MGAADVRLEVVRAPGEVVVLADGRPLPVPRGGDPRDVALAAARRHAARNGRVLDVELVDGGSTRLWVGPDGPVAPVPTPGSGPFPTPGSGPFLTPGSGPVPTSGRVSRPAVSSVAPSRWRRPVAAAPSDRRRPVGSLVAAALVAVAVLVGAVGTGVATLASSQALPDSCRPVTLYAVGGAGGGSDVLTAFTDPLAQQFGEKVSVVTVPPPATGGSYASAEAAAVGALSDAVGDHVEGCPTGSIMLFGYSAGAQVAGDLASRIGTGLEPRIPAELVRAVGLFGDPARSPATRAVPEGTTGQGVLPPRAVGFGTLDARTIQICAPGDPVCDSPATANGAPLDEALASPTHATYAQLPIAQGTSAPRWAVASLGKVVAAVPTDAGPAPSTAPTTTTDPAASGPASEYEEEPGAATTEAPAPSGTGADVTTRAPGDLPTTRAPQAGTGAGDVTATSAPGPRTGSGDATVTRAPQSGTEPGDLTTTRAPQSGTGSGDVTATPAPGRRTGSGDVTATRVPGAEAGDTATRAPRTPGSSGTGSATATGAPDSGSSDADAERGTTAATTTTRRPDATGESTEDGTDPSSGTGSSGQGSTTRATFALTKGLAGFKSTPWNNQNATDPSDAESPNVPGREAVKFEMPGGGKRTEAEPDIPEFQEGETKFVGYSGFFEQGFPTDTGTWQLIMQFKQPGTGSPPLAVEVGNGQLRLANNGGNQKDFCPVGPGAFSFQLGITFGGAIDAYCNGRQTLSGYRTPESNVKGSAYLKTGIYRDESIGQDSTLFLNDLKIGDDLAAVSGLAGAGGGSGATAAPAGGGEDGSDTPTTGRADSGDAASPSASTSASPSPRRTASAAPAAASTGAQAETANVRGQQICDKFGSTEIAGGAFLVQNNEWGAADGQCITATTQGFTVDSGEHRKDDAPASYPSIMSGCWMGTCTEGTTLPRRISELGPISSSIAGEIPAGTTSNLAYDLWADSTPRKDGHNDAVELMIWLKETGGIKPIGQQAGTATIGGATWDVWKGENGGVNVISYVRQGYVDQADDLPLTDFVNDAVAQGSVAATAFLTNIQAGFEPWTGGPGMALTRFDVSYGGG